MVWKILVTIMITLVILVVILSTNPDIARFFDGIFGRFSNVVESDEGRNTQFTLTLDSYDKVSYESSRPVNISLNASKFETKIGNVDVNATGKSIFITNYKGKIEVNDTSIVLDGSFETFLLPGAVSFPHGSINTAADFAALTLENFGPKELVLNSTGTLVIGSTENKFTGIIKLDSALGTFDFNDKLMITGKAKKISIPESGINIG